MHQNRRNQLRGEDSPPLAPQRLSPIPPRPRRGRWGEKRLFVRALFARSLCLLLLTLLLFPWLACSGSAAAPLLRISTENTADHVQTRLLSDFVDRVKARLGDSLTLRLHYGAELYRDRDVVGALRQGKVEMAVPGTWQLDRLVPDIGLFLLPLFYGRSREENYRVRDGLVGRQINESLRRTLGVKVLGRWIDLGQIHTFSLERPLTRFEDLQELRIRTPGGNANTSRLMALGAHPVLIAWPDLPMALSQGRVDGLITSHASVVSTRLWRNGLQYGFEDRQFFAQYVPLINAHFWHRMPDDWRMVLREEWERLVPEAREAAAQAQQEARERLMQEGLRITAPGHDALARQRRQLLAQQSRLVNELGIDRLLVEQATKALKAGEALP